MSIALIARVVRPRRPISLGTHILCQSRSTSIGSSPISSGFRCVDGRLLDVAGRAPRPMPVMPSSVSILTSREPVVGVGVLAVADRLVARPAVLLGRDVGDLHGLCHLSTFPRSQEGEALRLDRPESTNPTRAAMQKSRAPVTYRRPAPQRPSLGSIGQRWLSLGHPAIWPVP